MTQVRFHPAAAEEAEEAAAWYADERISLGQDFVRELDAALALLKSNTIPSTPHPHVPNGLGVRRFTLKRFKFDVVFVERGEALTVVAVAHHSRRPGYWKARLRT